MKKENIPKWVKIVSVFVIIIIVYLLIPKWNLLSCEFDNPQELINFNITCKDMWKGHKYSSLLKCMYPSNTCSEGYSCPEFDYKCGLGCKVENDTGRLKCLIVI